MNCDHKLLYPRYVKGLLFFQEQVFICFKCLKLVKIKWNEFSGRHFAKERRKLNWFVKINILKIVEPDKNNQWQRFNFSKLD